MPTSATNSPLPEAIVISVGPGAPNKEGKIITPDVKAGDRVLLPGWGGNSFKVGEDVRVFFIISEMIALFIYAFYLFIRNTTSSKIQKSLLK